MNDVEAMRLALNLAQFGEGDVNPNPLVGAVALKDGEIVGRGYHRRFGGAHAEVYALEEAGERARGATLVVTLEPCCHHGKTPPCTERIIEAGIARVVAAVRDPSSRVAGKGIAALQKAGIEVSEGVLAAEARRQNEIFFKYATRKLPFVQLKLACSLDGRIATRTMDSKWITSEASRIASHRLRRKFSSLLVGVSTVVQDDPQLTVRHVFGRDPIPVILDPTGRCPLNAQILTRRPILVTDSMEEKKERALGQRGAVIWRVPRRGEQFDLSLLLLRLGEEDIDSVLVEGGGETAASFLEAGLMDKVSLFFAPVLIGGKEAVPAVGGYGAERIADAWRLRDVTIERLDDDLIYTGYVDAPPFTGR